MNSETLRTFLTLARIKNYTQTANALFVAQSTVTNRILELESEIGKKLFIRSRRQLSLTREGEHFLPYAKRILELEASAMAEISNMSHYAHIIRLGTTNTIFDCHLNEKIVDFFNSHTDINLNITIGHSMPLIQMLQDKIIDMALTYVPYSRNQIASSLFTKDELLLVTNPENTSYRDGIRLENLAHIPYYYCDFTFQDLGSYIKELFPDEYAFPLVIDKSASLLPFLYTGKGYSFLPKSIVKKSLEAGTLIEIPLLDFTMPPVSCYVQYRKAEENEYTIALIKEELLKIGKEQDAL